MKILFLGKNAGQSMLRYLQMKMIWQDDEY